ncbi:MAG: hypothetical protein WDM89_04200 [Rhizomicrobium sp.]
MTTTTPDVQLKPMGINWIGLGTIVRREVSRIMRGRFRPSSAPWISALLFIFIFGFVLGGRIKEIGGHRYLEFVLPGILMMNIINAAFLQSTSAIYFQRFLRFIEETLVAPLSYVEMIVGMLGLRRDPFGRDRARNPGDRRVLRRHRGRQHFRVPVLVVAVSIIFGELGIIIGLWAKNFEQLKRPQRLLHRAAVDGGRSILDHRHDAALSALSLLRQPVLLLDQRAAPRDDRLPRGSAAGRRCDDCRPWSCCSALRHCGFTRRGTGCGSRRCTSWLQRFSCFPTSVTMNSCQPYQATLDSVSARADCKRKDYPDFILFDCTKGELLSVWYFTKPGSPAHPGAMKRSISNDKDGSYIDTNAKSYGPDGAQPAFKAWMEEIAHAIMPR